MKGQTEAGTVQSRGTRPQRSILPPGIGDARLVARYGGEALGQGYMAIPHVVVRYRRALGVTAGEWDYICELWSHWRSTALPMPSVDALSAGLRVDASTVRRYRGSLEAKGLLTVVPDGSCNRYDLRPLIDAAVGLDRLGKNARSEATHSDTTPCISPTIHRAESRPIEEVEQNIDNDSIPPHPLSIKQVVTYPSQGRHYSGVPGERDLVTVVDALSQELGDDTPDASITRGHNLYRTAGIPLAGFLALVDDAAQRTRGRQEGIVKRCRQDGRTPNGMPYLFATLQNLLRPLPAQGAGTAVGGPPRRRHAYAGERQDGHATLDTPGVRRIDDHRPDPDVGHVSSDLHPLWSTALGELRRELTHENYARWFAPTRVAAHDGAVLHIAVPDSFHQVWLSQRLRGAIERVLNRIAPGTQVEFIVDDAA